MAGEWSLDTNAQRLAEFSLFSIWHQRFRIRERPYIGPANRFPTTLFTVIQTNNYDIILDNQFQIVQISSGLTSVTHTAQMAEEQPQTTPGTINQIIPSYDITFGDFNSMDNLCEPTEAIIFCDGLSLSRLLGSETSELSDDDSEDDSGIQHYCSAGSLHQYHWRG